MSEVARLEMSARENRQPSRSLWRFLPLWLLLLLAVGIWWWFQAGRVSNAWGMLDGMVHAVSPEFSAKVEAILVREGDRVKRGQTVARMDVKGYSGRLDEAGREAASLRAVGPPGMEETAGRLEAAQDAEQDMVRRLALARHEEDMKRAAREERVAEHVRAQLNLRTLDSQGGERLVGKARYTAARQAESQARTSMERAKAAFEETSRMRAALDQELTRVREETLRYKQTASSNRYLHAPLGAAAAAARPATADGNLYAPHDGRILRGMAMPGQIVQRGEPVLLLLPEGQDAARTYWVMAYFPLESKDALKPGQECSVTLAEGGSLPGRIQTLLEPQVLPAGASVADAGVKTGAAASVLYLPARVTLEHVGEPPPMPGTAAACTVRTRALW